MAKSKLMQDWLDKVIEAPIDPAYPIIDPHHHLWLTSHRREFGYPIDDLARDTRLGHNILATVFIQCTTMYRESGPEHLKPVGETEWIESISEDFDRRNPQGPKLCAGIVGHVDFRLADHVDEALAAHKAATPRFRGIRQGASWSDDPEIVQNRVIPQRHLYMDPNFRKGFARLAKHDLSFDAWLFHNQLDELIDLARAFPDTQMVLDHIGAPLGQGQWGSQREQVFANWKQSIRELASLPNMHIKLGGTVMPMFGFHWESRPLPPSSDDLVKAVGHFFEAAIEAFTPARCMFESNFPVDKIACAYVPLWNSFKKVAAPYSASEKASLFHGTARRFYRLDGVAIPDATPAF